MTTFNNRRGLLTLALAILGCTACGDEPKPAEAKKAAPAEAAKPDPAKLPPATPAFIETLSGLDARARVSRDEVSFAVPTAKTVERVRWLHHERPELFARLAEVYAAMAVGDAVRPDDMSPNAARRMVVALRLTDAWPTESTYKWLAHATVRNGGPALRIVESDEFDVYVVPGGRPSDEAAIETLVTGNPGFLAQYGMR
jgi:hypothetical protein